MLFTPRALEHHTKSKRTWPASKVEHSMYLYPIIFFIYCIYIYNFIHSICMHIYYISICIPCMCMCIYINIHIRVRLTKILPMSVAFGPFSAQQICVKRFACRWWNWQFTAIWHQNSVLLKVQNILLACPKRIQVDMLQIEKNMRQKFAHAQKKSTFFVRRGLMWVADFEVGCIFCKTQIMLFQISWTASVRTALLSTYFPPNHTSNIAVGPQESGFHSRVLGYRSFPHNATKKQRFLV